MGLCESSFKNFNPTEVYTNTKVKVRIDYCNSWGYDSKANALSEAIKKVYPKADFEMVPIGGNTGCFEVYANNKLIHSKKNGDGQVTNITDFMKKMHSAVQTN